MGQRLPKSLASDIIGAADRLTIEEDDLLFDLLFRQQDQVWILDPKAGGVWYNEAYYTYTGKTPEYMRNWAWQDFLPLDEIPRVAGSLYRSLLTGEKWESVHPIKGADDRYRQFLVRGVPLHDKRGNIKYWIGSQTDITDYIRPDLLHPSCRKAG